MKKTPSRSKKKSPPIKKLSLKMVGLDGNAFVLMGAFKAQARKEGWTPEETEAVLSEARSGDYPHLVSVLASHSTCPAG